MLANTSSAPQTTTVDKKASLKARLRSELDESLVKLAQKSTQLEEKTSQHEILTKINSALHTEIKSIRSQLKDQMDASKGIEDSFWALARIVVGDAEIASKDVDHVMQVAQQRMDVDLQSPQPMQTPSDDEHLAALSRILYGDLKLTTSKGAWKAVCADITTLKNEANAQTSLVAQYEAQIQTLLSQHRSYETLLGQVAQEAASRTSQLDFEKNQIMREAIERTSASDNERLRVENIASELMMKGNEEVARLVRELEALQAMDRDNVAVKTELENRLSVMREVVNKQAAPHFLGSATLGRLVYGDLHKSFATHWKPDSEAKSCSQCSRAFGTLTRRHHCRSCGDVFCASHVAKQLNLTLGDLTISSTLGVSGKVCDACFNRLQGNTILDLESLHQGDVVAMEL
ncbi:hypothetical protein SmJEL517_g05843 [Synchytrium microbalum]|uniref:FYVE-type domain-containing protein n=1 Tax=Synchytrium microbalum TaxID=1806994 RepID=A0A507BY37_9FUNG|nr:uncharacterized protein SmJEL517_g05843 [Synchytrium microbalum]TPX30636.1 hypothetical protein SmJEL517_g05843 [Synchytrium microbalum]